MRSRIHLVSDWRRAWRWYSTNSMALAAALLGAWAALPERMQESFSPLELKLAAITLILLGIGGRMVQQGGRRDK
ncbi:MAG: hypothetical protein REI09_11215 [Candidatus Dactylopiibacterium sp.]|nr:hypothetical protein [Candidatus Dactylopiibacterium sp.]